MERWIANKRTQLIITRFSIAVKKIAQENGNELQG
jgi:hypothetical protein